MASVPGSPYDALSYRELQAECKKRGLKALAKRPELSRSLEEHDKSPAATTPKGRPRPAITTATTPSTLRTATTYPPPTPPYSEDSDSGSEPPSPHQPASPSNTPKRTTPRADVPSPLARYPVPATHYVPTDHPSEKPGKIPGWVLQAAFAAFFLALTLMIAYSGPSGNPSEAKGKE